MSTYKMAGTLTHPSRISPCCREGPCTRAMAQSSLVHNSGYPLQTKEKSNVKYHIKYSTN